MNLSITKTKLEILVQIFLFMIPAGLIAVPIFKVLWYTLLFISLIIFFCNYFAAFKLKKNDKDKLDSILIFMLLYQMFVLVATYQNGGNWMYTLMTIFVVSAVILYSEDTFRKNKLDFLWAVDIALLINILIEVTGEMFGIGNFLQIYACAYVYYGVWATIHLIYLELSKKKDYLVYIISVIMIIPTIINPDKGFDNQSSYEWTFYIMVIIECSIILFRPILSKLKIIFNMHMSYLFISAFNLIFVVFQLPTRLGFIRFILIDIMHKDMTFTGRTGIWRLALSYIKMNIWRGYGTGLKTLPNMGGSWRVFMQTYGPHNQFLATWLISGIFGLFFYMLLILKSSYKVLKYKNKYISVIMSAGFLSVYLELSLTYRNVINCIPLYIMFVICCNIDYLMGKAE